MWDAGGIFFLLGRKWTQLRSRQGKVWVCWSCLKLPFWNLPLPTYHPQKNRTDRLRSPRGREVEGAQDSANSVPNKIASPHLEEPTLRDRGLCPKCLQGIPRHSPQYPVLSLDFLDSLFKTGWAAKETPKLSHLEGHDDTYRIQHPKQIRRALQCYGILPATDSDYRCRCWALSHDCCGSFAGNGATSETAVLRCDLLLRSRGQVCARNSFNIAVRRCSNNGVATPGGTARVLTGGSQHF